MSDLSMAALASAPPAFDYPILEEVGTGGIAASEVRAFIRHVHRSRLSAPSADNEGSAP
jgi:hypothetical protein